MKQINITLLKHGLFLMIMISMAFGGSYSDGIEDTLVIRAVQFSDPSPVGWNEPYRCTVVFPEETGPWRKIVMVQTLKCDSATAGDKYPCGEWDYIWNTLVEVDTGDSLEMFSLGSFVTPYGKRLKLGGDQGWTWEYDVTDYAPILTGEKNLITGNNQELLDLKFYFIKGIPPRTTLGVENVYPYGTYKYAELAGDSLLKEVSIRLSPQASMFQLKAVISGHGHAGPRNCCEWDSKTHTYFLNKWETYRWNVWKDCGANPIYPQGGTWPFDRAGWCPGTKVDEYVFDITPKVSPGDTILIDYEIEAPRDNGEDQGHFRMSHQLFSFGPPNHNVDAEVLEILSPSTSDAHSRNNPSCGAPQVLIRNAGGYPLTELTISYGMEGKLARKYVWSGELSFMETALISLPPLPERWLNKVGTFYVNLELPKAVDDENPVNNRLRSEYIPPLVFPGDLILSIHTNNVQRARENQFMIMDNDGLVWYARGGFADSTLYRIPLELSPGCYHFEFSDDMQDGISRHWWYRDSAPELIGINGRVQFETLQGDTIKSFPADFGESLNLDFIVR